MVSEHRLAASDEQKDAKTQDHQTATSDAAAVLVTHFFVF
jgi:hypothetical protein